MKRDSWCMVKMNWRENEWVFLYSIIFPLTIHDWMDVWVFGKAEGIYEWNICNTAQWFRGTFTTILLTHLCLAVRKCTGRGWKIQTAPILTIFGRKCHIFSFGRQMGSCAKNYKNRPSSLFFGINGLICLISIMGALSCIYLNLLFWHLLFK